MEKEMVRITSCNVTECAYNKHNACHTLAITVGGPSDPCPSCDTYLSTSQKGGIMDVQGGVRVCQPHGHRVLDRDAELFEGLAFHGLTR